MLCLARIYARHTDVMHFLLSQQAHWGSDYVKSAMPVKHGTIGYVMYGFLLVCYSNFVPKRLFDFEKCHDL